MLCPHSHLPHTHFHIHTHSTPVIQRMTWRVTDVARGSGTEEHPGSTDADSTASPIRGQGRERCKKESERDAKKRAREMQKRERERCERQRERKGNERVGNREWRELHLTADSGPKMALNVTPQAPHAASSLLCARRRLETPGSSSTSPRLVMTTVGKAVESNNIPSCRFVPGHHSEEAVMVTGSRDGQGYVYTEQYIVGRLLLANQIGKLELSINNSPAPLPLYIIYH